MQLRIHGCALLIGMAVAASVPGEAQITPTATVLTSGLLGPRGLKFGPDGMLYVAEAGVGGSTDSGTLPCLQVGPPGGPYHGGPSGRVSMIDRSGNRTTVADGLPSARSGFPTKDTLGVADVAFLDGTLYAVTAGGGCSHGNINLPNGIVRIDRKTGSWKYIVNLSNVVQIFPAAYPDIQNYAPSDYEPDGTFYGMVAHKGKLYTVEANHGQVFSVTPDGDAEQTVDFSRSEGHIVPTGITAHNDNLYVGNLGLFPIIPQRERVITLSEHFHFYDASAGLGVDPAWHSYQIASSHAGFTTVVGVEFGPDGLPYVLEYSDAPGYQTAGAGKVVRVDRDGTIEEVVTGLTEPTALTFGPDLALYISNYGDTTTGSGGQIVRVVVPLLY